MSALRSKVLLALVLTVGASLMTGCGTLPTITLDCAPLTCVVS